MYLKIIKEENNFIIHTYKLTTHPKYLMFNIGTFERLNIFSDTPLLECDTCELIHDLEINIKYLEKTHFKQSIYHSQ